jgi:6-phosphogluconolactonase (cycloisomerase 2 family)
MTHQLREANTMTRHLATTAPLTAFPLPLHAELSATFVQAGRLVLSNPHDLKLSSDGQYLFVTDVGNDRIVHYRLTPSP